jgi:hypothetical protein
MNLRIVAQLVGAGMRGAVGARLFVQNMSATSD